MHKKSSNRSFGILFFLVFLGFGLWPLTKEMSPNIYLIIISVIFLTLGLLNSKLLSPINEIWIKFGEILGKIIAPLIMALVYFLILTPISLLLRLSQGIEIGGGREGGGNGIPGGTLGLHKQQSTIKDNTDGATYPA